MFNTALLQFFAATGEQPSGIGALGINPQAFLLQVVTFVILFFLLKRFAFSAIVKMLEERRQAIDDGVRLGRQMEAEKAKLDEQVSASLREARVQADRIIAEAHAEAGGIIKAAEEAAERKVDGMIADARGKIDQDLKKAHDGLKRDILVLVSEATEAIIEEKLDASRDARLIEKAVSGVQR